MNGLCRWARDRSCCSGRLGFSSPHLDRGGEPRPWRLRRCLLSAGLSRLHGTRGRRFLSPRSSRRASLAWASHATASCARSGCSRRDDPLCCPRRAASKRTRARQEGLRELVPSRSREKSTSGLLAGARSAWRALALARAYIRATWTAPTRSASNCVPSGTGPRRRDLVRGEGGVGGAVSTRPRGRARCCPRSCRWRSKR
jgi:hypothetical protein